MLDKSIKYLTYLSKDVTIIQLAVTLNRKKINNFASLTNDGVHYARPSGDKRYSELLKGGKKCQQLTSSSNRAERRQ